MSLLKHPVTYDGAALGITRRGTALFLCALFCSGALPTGPANPWPADERGIGEGAVGTSSTGAMEDGFALSLTTERDSNEAPEALVELRNLSHRPRQVKFAGMAYAVTIKDALTGRFVVVGSQLRSWHSEKPNGEPLYPETSLYAKFELAKTYALEGGRYLVTVTGYPTIDGTAIRLISNSIVVTMPPRKLPWTPLPNASNVLKTVLASNRPVYVRGEAILLRIWLTNKTAYGIVLFGGDHQEFTIRRSFGRSADAPHTTTCELSNRQLVGRPLSLPIQPGSTILLQDFRRFNQWYSDFSNAACRFNEPGWYSLSAGARASGIVEVPGALHSFSEANVIPSDPLAIRIVTQQEAATIAPTLLDNRAENVAIGRLLPRYAELRHSLLDFIAEIRPGDTQTQADVDFGQRWQEGYDGFRSGLALLNGLGDPASRYVNVTANLDEAAYHLREAGQDVHDYCDSLAARSAIGVADYFVAAVDEELKKGSASVLDASDPAPTLQPRGGLCLAR
ncbi:MAG TPA: hypothetical protein VKR56_01385 [Candidatus Cybelea sp.]|nr:hypothetical protein [Candidatus Cybelea sp.]